MHRSRSVHELGLARHVGWAGNVHATPLCSESAGAAVLERIAGTLLTASAIAASCGSTLLAAVTRRRMGLYPTTYIGFPQAQSLVSSRMARSWLDLYTSLALHSHMRAATRRYHCAGLQTAAHGPAAPPNPTRADRTHVEPPRGAGVPCCAVVSLAVSGIFMPVRHTNRTESSTKQPAAQLSVAPRGLTTQHTSWRAPYRSGLRSGALCSPQRPIRSRRLIWS